MLFYRCCSSRNCSNPQPTLQDWWALAYCYAPRTVLCIEALGKGLMLAVMSLVVYVLLVLAMNMDVILGMTP
jgi:hypothetical protein